MCKTPVDPDLDLDEHENRSLMRIVMKMMPFRNTGFAVSFS
jgi:hypothetical protein